MHIPVVVLLLKIFNARYTFFLTNIELMVRFDRFLIFLNYLLLFVIENGDPTRQPVTLNDAMLELEDLLKSNNIINYQMETCKRKYVFGMPDVPREAEYIKLNYPYTGNIIIKYILALT